MLYKTNSILWMSNTGVIFFPTHMKSYFWSRNFTYNIYYIGIFHQVLNWNNGKISGISSAEKIKWKKMKFDYWKAIFIDTIDEVKFYSSIYFKNVHWKYR